MMRSHKVNKNSALSVLVLVIALVLISTNAGLCSTPAMQLLLEQSPSNGGKVAPASGVHHYAPDSEVFITAIPEKGYKFAYWIGDVSEPKSQTTSVKLNSSKIVIAVFALIPTYDPDDKHSSGPLAGGAGSFNPSVGSFTVPITPDLHPGAAVNPPSGRGDGRSYGFPASSAPVPEPATIFLLGLGTLSLLRTKKARRK